MKTKDKDWRTETIYPGTFNVEKIAFYEELMVPEICKNTGKVIRIMDPITDWLLYYTREVGIPEITKKNYKDFYTRIRMMPGNEKLTVKGNNGVNRRIALWDIERRIGLSCDNKKFKKTRSAFLNGLYEKQAEHTRRLQIL